MYDIDVCFVKVYVYRCPGRYIIHQEWGNLICNARNNWKVKRYKLNRPAALTKVGIRAILTVETPSLVVLRVFKKFSYKISNI